MRDPISEFRRKKTIKEAEEYRKEQRKYGAYMCYMCTERENKRFRVAVRAKFLMGALVVSTAVILVWGMLV